MVILSLFNLNQKRKGMASRLAGKPVLLLSRRSRYSSCFLFFLPVIMSKSLVNCNFLILTGKSKYTLMLTFVFSQWP